MRGKYFYLVLICIGTFTNPKVSSAKEVKQVVPAHCHAVVAWWKNLWQPRPEPLAPEVERLAALGNLPEGKTREAWLLEKRDVLRQVIIKLPYLSTPSKHRLVELLPYHPAHYQAIVLNALREIEEELESIGANELKRVDVPLTPTAADAPGETEGLELLVAY